MKNLLKSIAFLLILAILVCILSGILRPKGNLADDGMIEPSAMGILAEPENSLDVLFLGDSVAYCCFDPIQLQREAGVASYVCSGVDQRLYQAEEYLDLALERQSPRLVFLETNILYRDHGTLEWLCYTVERYIPAFRYHNRWKTLKLRDFDPTVCYDSPVAEKGYYPHNEITPADTSLYALPTEERAPVPARNARMLARMAERCRRAGAQLVLLSAPTTINWDMERHNALSDLAETLELPYFDLNLLPDEVPIDWSLDTLDGGDHLNVTGAEKVTAWVGRYVLSSPV